MVADSPTAEIETIRTREVKSPPQPKQVGDLRPVVAVVPAGERDRRPRLFAALEEAVDVSIVGHDDPEALRCVARIVVAEDSTAHSSSDDVPTLLLFGEYGRGDDSAAFVELASSEALDAVWRGRRMLETGGRGLRRVVVAPGDEVLATIEGRPIWVRRHGSLTSRASTMPAELAAHETLRHRFRPGRFIELLPILVLLRVALAEGSWTPPSVRAALMFDDPNLHCSSYGYLRFEELASAAATYGYHAACAMVPLDGWHASSAAVSVFRREKSQLSLLMHGNDHLQGELGRPLMQDHRRTLLAQALRRVDRFERRYGIPVSRVMAPPHGRCSSEMAQEMVAFGFEGLCMSNPRLSSSDNSVAHALSGWRVIDLSDGGLPTIPRYHLAKPRDELAFRAFLGQPIILYGHHGEAAGGLDFINEAAADVNRLGDVQWLSLTQIARGNFATRRQRGRLEVRLFSRRVEIDLPDDVDELVIHSEVTSATADDKLMIDVPNGSRPIQLALGVSEGIRLTGPGRAVVVRTQRVELDPRSYRAPRWSPWPFTRRLLTEARDRAHPLVTGNLGRR